jgi:large subunit ribosomal protein L6
MSRVGAQPIQIPEGITVTVDARLVRVKGPKGELSHTLPSGITATVAHNEIRLGREKESRELSALWGTSRALVANMVHGVMEGFEKKLEVHGVGYRAQAQGDTLQLNIGFSHPVEVRAPNGITFGVEKNVITVSGIDKILVGETAAKIRKVRKPEPYKGKGIRYEGEVVRRKAGKKAAGAE